MAFNKTHLNVGLPTGGGAANVGPQDLALASAYVTNGVPCRGARYVVVRMKGTNSQVPSAMALNVGNQQGRTLNFTGAVAAGGHESALRGSLSLRCDQGGGNTMMLAMAANTGWFYHDFVQVTFTSSAGTAQTQVTVDVEVWYDSDSDVMQRSAGLAALAVPTT